MSSATLNPLLHIGSLAPQEVATVIQAGSDLAIVMDEQAIIQGLAFGNSELYSKNLQAWVGQNWEETVSLESRIKVQTLIKAATRLPRDKSSAALIHNSSIKSVVSFSIFFSGRRPTSWVSSSFEREMPSPN